MMNILLAIDFENLHTLLRSLYDEMMPLCANMAGVARAIAGLGALFYIAYRVWQSLARAEAIDVFPLLRPFAIGLCILMFPTVVLGTLNAVMTPIVQGVATMLEGEKLDMQQYREQKDKLEYEAMKRNPETAYLVSNEEFDKQLEELGWSPGDAHVLPHRAGDIGASGIRHIGVGRLSVHAHPMALPIYPGVSVASRL